MALLVLQHTWLQTCHRIQPSHGGQFTARQDKVAQADLQVHMGVDEALVHAFIAAAQQHRAWGGGSLQHQRLVQSLTHRRKINQGGSLAVFTTGLADGVQAGRQGLGQHHHAGAAAERAVVHPPVVAIGIVTRVPAMHRHLAAFVGAAGHAHLEESLNQLGEQGDDVYTHGRLSNRLASPPGFGGPPNPPDRHRR